MKISTNSSSRIVSGSIYLERMSEPCLIDDFSGVYIGKSKICKIPFFLDLDKLINRNIAILGMSGSGKSYFLRSFIIRSNLQRGSSVLIIDWNNEYRDIVDFLGGKTFTLGTTLRINIFELYDLENVKNIKSISDVISSSINLNEEESYLVYNKILFMNSKKGNSNLNLRGLIDGLNKDRNALSKIISNKLLQLKDNPMFADKIGFSMQDILDGVISIDFSMLRDDTQRGEISKTIFRIIIELMHNSILGINKNNEKIIVLDEAWRLIKNSEDVGVLFREGRKYGFCVAVATQIANDINNEVISNVACLLLFRLQNDSDYKLLVDSGIINEEYKKAIMHLHVGGCLVSMALKEDNSRISKFFIDHTDGIMTDFYNMIIGGKMQNRVSYRLFMESTRKIQASNEIKESIINFIRENNNEIDDIQLVKFMLNLKLERSEIIYYLRNLGLKDLEIVKAYDNAVTVSVN